ncbi:voltage-dependent calcium channel gamma-5 subunit-like isoform X2 [Pomacea canaliculata]|uniref:voltage-dependent calcium channel gamma-5 subunit-like isoform X2 n=1 Tax=Pomacea canaliculata TaxID=400727 RepID=UPI000D7276BE|nr:voltage-dependent calcium channel gamma-5 subunit-like isoform X2 [Pomacea canaliculata]
MKCSVYRLTIVSFAMAAMAVTVLSLAVATDSWLLMREKMVFEGLALNDSWTRVWAGMWRLCMEMEYVPNTMECMPISYTVGGSRGENMTLTALTIIGNIRRDVRTLVGAVCYVLAGLSLAVGMILYISAVNDEVGYRSSTMQEEGGFSYGYGWSFFIAGVGFLTSEIAAVVGVTLFLKRNAKMEDMIRIIPGLEDKVDPVHVYTGKCGVHNAGASRFSDNA